MSGGGKGSKSVTVGYRYYAGMHLALCHGPVDSLNKIVVGERTAWSGVADVQRTDCHQPARPVRRR